MDGKDERGGQGFSPGDRQLCFAAEPSPAAASCVLTEVRDTHYLVTEAESLLHLHDLPRSFFCEDAVR